MKRKRIIRITWISIPADTGHIPKAEIDAAANMVVDPGNYRRPAKEIIAEKLTPRQFAVTQEAGTERPFENEYWDNFQRGIYVDIVTGEPLFFLKRQVREFLRLAQLFVRAGRKRSQIS